MRETNGGCLFGENNLNQIQQIDDGNKSQSADGYGVQPCSVSDDGKLDYQSRRNAAAGNNQPVVFDIYEQKCADSCRNQNIWTLQHAVKTVEKVSERRNMKDKSRQQQADDNGQNIKGGVFLHDVFSERFFFSLIAEKAESGNTYSRFAQVRLPFSFLSRPYMSLTMLQP